MIGHAEALREYVSDSVGWRYADPDNERLSALVWFFAGVSLPDLDAAIETLETEGAPAGSELRQRRQKALTLFRAEVLAKPDSIEDLSDYAFSGHIEWIMLRTHSIKSSDVVKPLARIGRSIKDGGAKGAAASRKTRRGANSKRAAILAEATAYTGPQNAMISTIAKRVGATDRYVRQVLRNTEP